MESWTRRHFRRRHRQFAATDLNSTDVYHGLEKSTPVTCNSINPQTETGRETHDHSSSLNPKPRERPHHSSFKHLSRRALASRACFTMSSTGAVKPSVIRGSSWRCFKYALYKEYVYIYIYIYIYGRVVIPPPLHFSIFGIAPNTIQCGGCTDPSHAPYREVWYKPIYFLHMTEIRYIHGPEYITYNILNMCSILQHNEMRRNVTYHDRIQHFSEWHNTSYHIISSVYFLQKYMM